ncbi:MAG TPA: pyridoxamine 5'-phosphate oxidase [Verrucomicrobiaceae bacterium]|jgi:pyridoxamine 5'-phosphate oxidase
MSVFYPSPAAAGKPNLAELRRRYELGTLDEATLPGDPFALFRFWLDDAIAAGLMEVNAMTLATVSADGQPSSRTVLLKGFDERGFSFFTNYHSRKGRELDGNARAALTIYWKERERQVCLRGTVNRLGREESDVYFQSRPYESQIGAWVSEQSERIPNRAWMENRKRELMEKYPEGSVPLPPNWGGYVLAPHDMEFWQGRPGRLHDRMLYEKRGEAWVHCRLSP